MNEAGEKYVKIDGVFLLLHLFENLGAYYASPASITLEIRLRWRIK